MKNIFKYSAMMLLSVLAFTLGACTEEYEYTKVKANGEQVYFRNDISVASMAKDRDTVQVPVNRIQSKGELQVQLQVTQESNSKLSIPSTVTFADGETQAYLVISYDPAAIDYGFSEDVTVAIADESLTTQYGNSSCTFTVELSEWETIGQGLYKDGVFSIYGLDDVTSQVTIQENMFKALGFTKKRAYEQFGYLMDALDMGFPPHAGLAIGLDRFAMMLADKDNIRDVLAFPKNASASEPMMHAPAPVADQQLADLGIEVEDKYQDSVKATEARLEKMAAEDAEENSTWDK